MLQVEKIVERVSRRAIDKVSFIGAGNMAYAIASGLLRRTGLTATSQAGLTIESPSQISVYAPSERNLPKFRDQLKCRTYTSLSTIQEEKADVVFVCVKPQILTNCLSQKRPLMELYKSGDHHSPIVVSIAAGVSINNLKKTIVCPDGTFVRIMTNTSCSLGNSVCTATIDPEVNLSAEKKNDLQETLKTFLSPLGEILFVEENNIDAITALLGSGPAFSLMFLQSMSDGGVKMGLPRHLSTKLASYAMAGASSMVLKTREHPFALRDNICSPGGTTIHGIHALERHGVSSGIIEAVEMATKRSVELSHH